MSLGFAIIGFIIGGIVSAWGGHFLLGALGGAFIAVALSRLSGLQRRVRELESRIGALRGDAGTARAAPVEPPAARPTRPDTDPAAPEPAKTPAGTSPLEAFADRSEPLETGEPAKVPKGWPQPKRKRTPARPSPLETGLKKAADWFTTGNVPVKVGVIVTFIGMSFLLKYAIDQKLLVIPIEFRLLGVAAIGLGLVVIGWRLRDKVRVYALSLQGGGAGILFLTIFAAFRIWDLLPAPLAFFLLVALTFFTGALAVLQDSRSLAILGISGGFLAPILTSTGQGNHVILFSYYLVLNGAILGISWYRAWRELNLLGWVFTFLVGSLWGYRYYKPELWASTQPFLVLHFLFYNVIAMLFALRQPPGRIGIVDGTLVFGTPVIAFALQAELVEGSEYGLAISAAVAAVFYAVSATWLYRGQGEKLRLLTESFIALAVAFATIAIPLALDARWTSAAWALEGAALVWVGTRQGRQLAKLAGALLVFFSGASFMEYGWRDGAGIPVLNGNVLGGVLISLSALFASRKLETIRAGDFEPVQKLFCVILFLWGALWWVGTGFVETVDRVTSDNEAHVFLLFLTLSMGAAAWLGQARDWALLRRATLAFLPFIVLTAFYQALAHDHLLAGLGWLAWPLAWAGQGYLLRVMDEHDESPAAAWHFISLLLLAALLSLEAYWWTDQQASTAWAGAVASAVTGVIALLVWRLRRQPDWPVPAHPVSYLNASLVLVAVQVLLLASLSIDNPGNPYPLPYIPVVNPFDLGMLFAMLTSMLSLAVVRRESATETGVAAVPYLPGYKLMLAAAFFVMTTAALVRGVHHYTGVPWDADALFASVIVQTSLSIYWGLLGFAGMIWGARSLRRPVWLTGAGFMALVVIKLFLVDLGNTGTVARIISFIGIGALLLVVGYFAPAPPRRRQGTDANKEDRKSL